MPAEQPADRGDGVAAALRRVDRVSCRTEECSAGVGQLDLPGAAHEQVTAELLLERADRTREARLGEMHPRGGSGEVTLVGDGEKVL